MNQASTQATGLAASSVDDPGLPHPASRAIPSQGGDGTRRPWHRQYLPTLLDRLCDDAPHQPHETPQHYTVTRAQLRNIVQRDLSHLLNTTHREDLMHPQRHAQVARSVLNYGLPPMAGSYVSGQSWNDIEQRIRHAVLAFEPRLLPHTLVIRPLGQASARSHYNVLSFEISASLHAQPYPVEFCVQSSIDLETSHIQLRLKATP